eukprot:TRINITY_DN5053_c0_g1_i2.p1 TRINITY_DN5053_c0_g1~~TRINITY_DN5053_c0_g1_i2.p1  ORF type:complete len:273 (-),score=50.40 TRINITY_DN5053_c0_g1_i2:242-1060(-)
MMKGKEQEINEEDKVKILVVGDTGVGKTSIVHLLCQGKVLNNPQWTEGCNLDVMIHNYQDSNIEKEYFVEFWDVGGSLKYMPSRHIFYDNADGIVFVHDLSNKKSLTNLQNWEQEIFQVIGGVSQLLSDESEVIEMRYINGSQTLPIMKIGNKLDLCRTKPTIDHEQGTRVMHINALSPTTFKEIRPQQFMNDFLNKVIHAKFYQQYWHMYRTSAHKSPLHHSSPSSSVRDMPSISSPPITTTDKHITNRSRGPVLTYIDESKIPSNYMTSV